MRIYSMLFAVSLILIQWNYTCSRYISSSSRAMRPRAPSHTRRLHDPTSLTRQRSPLPHIGRTSSISRHNTRRQPMSYRTFRQPVSDTASVWSRLNTQQRLPLNPGAKVSQTPIENTVRVGYISTNDDDEKISGFSIGTRISEQSSIPTLSAQQSMFRRPLSTRRRISPQLHGRRNRRPHHNIFIRTKSGRKIKISHSLGNTNIVLNTASLNKQQFQHPYNRLRSQRKRLSGSYKTTSDKISSIADVKVDTNSIPNEVVPEKEIVQAPIISKQAWNKTIDLVKTDKDKHVATSNKVVPATLTKPSTLSTSTPVNSTISLQNHKTSGANLTASKPEPALKSNKPDQTDNIHTSRSYKQPSTDPISSTKISTQLPRNENGVSETPGIKPTMITATKLKHPTTITISGQSRSTISARTSHPTTITSGVNNRPITVTSGGSNPATTSKNSDPAISIPSGHGDPTMSITSGHDAPTIMSRDDGSRDDGSRDLPEPITEDIDGPDTADGPDTLD